MGILGHTNYLVLLDGNMKKLPSITGHLNVWITRAVPNILVVGGQILNTACENFWSRP